MSAVVSVSLVLLGISIIYFLLPPKKINYLYGYRTPKSMKNQENWVLSNKLGAKYLIISSLFNIIVSVVLSYILKIEFIEYFLALIIFEFILIIFLIEKQLK